MREKQFSSLRNPSCHILLFILGEKMNFHFSSRDVNSQYFSIEVHSSYIIKSLFSYKNENLFLKKKKQKQKNSEGHILSSTWFNQLKVFSPFQTASVLLTNTVIYLSEKHGAFDNGRLCFLSFCSVEWYWSWRLKAQCSFIPCNSFLSYILLFFIFEYVCTT